MRAFIVALALMVTLSLVVEPTAAVPAPATPTATEGAVGQKVAWLVDASRRVPVGADEVRAHLSPALIDSLGGVAGFNALLQRTGPLSVTSLRRQPMREDVQGFGLADGAGGTRWHLVLIAQPDGLIAAVVLTPVPRTWAALDAHLAALAPRASLVAATVDSHGCRPVHAWNPDRTGPMASGFKGYVLGALVEAVSVGRARWDELLAIRGEWIADHATPFGQLPVGAVRTLREYAEAMMFYSDNTATEHLMRRLGRGAVEVQQVRYGHRDPLANVPFPTPREIFVLKADNYPQLADRYEAMGRWERRQFLDREVAARPLPTASWREPRNIDTIEWFGTAADLCRSFAGLWRDAAAPAGAPAGAALALQGTAQVGLDPATWPVGWSKGGSEPGVLTRSMLAGTADGRTFVVTLMVSDPETASVNDTATAAGALALTAGAFELLR